MTAGAEKPNGRVGSPSSPPSQRESMSLKRGREGSVDHLASGTPSITPIAAKKNRVEGEHYFTQDTSENEDEGSQEAAVADVGKEGRTVGEVRRKVQEMGWKEGDPKPQSEDLGADQDNEGDKEVLIEDKDKEEVESEPEAESEAKAAAVEGQTSPTLKRKASENTAVAASEDKKHKSASPPPEPKEKDQETKEAAAEDKATDAAETTPTAPASPTPVKKPQATFGSFSAKASPFASASSSTSAFGAASGSSAFGSAAGSSSPFGAAAKNKSVLDTKPAAPSAFSSSGFGNYSSTASPFAKKPPAAVEEKETQSSSFGDILKEKGDDAESAHKLHLDKHEGPTGEEDEDTVYSTRAKLFVMESEGGWKERGVGQLKLNKRRDDGSARLIMRVEGVLRVILNAKLYVGMPCLEDGKHIRSTVFEDGERRFITIRTANPKSAQELSEVIHEHTPLESRASASRSPEAESDGDEV